MEKSKSEIHGNCDIFSSHFPSSMFYWGKTKLIESSHVIIQNDLGFSTSTAGDSTPKMSQESKSLAGRAKLFRGCLCSSLWQKSCDPSGALGSLQLVVTTRERDCSFYRGSLSPRMYIHTFVYIHPPEINAKNYHEMAGGLVLGPFRNPVIQ